MKKILSVSIAAYNVESTIQKCLDSFLKSNYIKDLELLVVNDGSSDKTLSIVSEYENKYPGIIKVINKKNGGHGSTINTSLEYATGKYFKVVDGDDWVKIDELDRLISRLNKENVDLIINGFSWVFPNEYREQHDEMPFSLNKVYLFEDLLKNNRIQKYFFMHAITVRTEILREINMHITEKCFYADNEYNFFVYMATKTICFDNSCAYQYRMGTSGQSVSAEGQYRHLEDRLKILEEITSIYQNHEDNLSLEKKKYLLHYISDYYNGIFSILTNVIKKSGKDRMAIRFLYNFKEMHPNYLHIKRINKITLFFPILFISLFRNIKDSFLWDFIKKHKR